jgi:glycosyltransferase involved in cell wall biosynthesis
MLITTYNRGELLERALSRLADLTQPDELIVVNDGGEDDCSGIVADWYLRTGTRSAYHYLDNPRYTTCSAARNHGVGHCAGDLILISEPEVVFIDDIVARFAEFRAQLGRPAVLKTDDAFRARPGDLSADPAACWQHTPGEVPPYVTMFDRASLEAIGGWDETMPAPWGGDDTDLLERLHQFGVDQVVVPEARIVHLDHPRNSQQLDMTYAMANFAHIHRKPYNHGLDDHICSPACMKARGIIL